MSKNFQLYLDTLNADKFPSIIPPNYLDCIRNIVLPLPALSVGCFECYLGDHTRVDLNISITGYLNEHQRMSEWPFENFISKDHQLFDIYSIVKNFCKDWKSASFNLRSFIHALWMVYDIPDPTARNIIPWYYITFTTFRFPAEPSFKWEMFTHILGRLQQPVNDIKHNAESLFNNLSPAYDIHALGFRNQRRTIRIYLVIKEYRQVFNFLKQHHWPGNIDELQSLIDRFSEGCDLFGLAVDIDGGILARIGIELWAHSGKPNKQLIKLATLLTDFGLCTEIQKQAIVEWEDEFYISNIDNMWTWPDRFYETKTIPAAVYIRRLSRYVKLVYSPGEPLTVKSYLYFDRDVFEK